MWDTFKPLRLTTLWRDHDKPEYALSWNPDRAPVGAWPDVRGGTALLARHPRRRDGVVVHLDRDHPGADDPEYRARRDEIAAAALAWTPGKPAPAIALHRARAGGLADRLPRARAASTSATPCRAYREAAAALDLPHDAIPQLDEVSARLEPLTGFRYVPAAGLVPLRGVLRLARRPHLPLDPVHPPPGGAALHARAGPDPRGDRPREPARVPRVRASSTGSRARPRDAARRRTALQFLARRLLVHDRVRRGRTRTASCARTAPGILSSYGEIEEFRTMEIRPDRPAARWARSSTTSRATSRSSTRRVDDPPGGRRWAASSPAFDDDTPERLGAGSPAAAR